MSTLNTAERLPVDVSNFLRIISLLLDLVVDEDDNVPAALEEYNGITMININVRSRL